MHVRTIEKFLLFMALVSRTVGFSVTIISKLPTPTWWINTLARNQHCRRHGNNSNALRAALSSDDEKFLRLAVDHAKKGLGSTFPNPAVGCVLVRQDTGEVIGSGFHPRAGFPHAEIFALFEAAGHVQDGIQAAEDVIKSAGNFETVEALLREYASDKGPEKLFQDALVDQPTTAYVTLEPCSHYGRTPPCAYALVVAKASRVVVGFRDPNPRVDGGGVQLLRDHGIQVDMAEEEVRESCHDIIRNFVKRISPSPLRDNYDYLRGAHRSALRSLANQKKNQGEMCEFHWEGKPLEAGNDDSGFQDVVSSVDIPANWMERLDDALWKEELVLLRLGAAIPKKKWAKILGERISQHLKAHVAQTVGHTVLLYRPSAPKIIDLDSLVPDEGI